MLDRLASLGAARDSINGTAPTGSATISESAGTVRTVEVLSPVGAQPTFYRLRVTMLP